MDPVQNELFNERENTAASVSPVQSLPERQELRTTGDWVPRIIRDGTRDSESTVQREERDVRLENKPRKDGTRTERVGLTSHHRTQEPKEERQFPKSNG